MVIKWPLTGFRLLVLLLACSAPAIAQEAPLSLPEAERIAVERDAGRQQLEQEAAAARDDARASSALPDPEVRLGAVNLPVDSFALDEQAMTQLLVGIRQVFPPGDTLELLEARGNQLAIGSERQAENRVRQIRLAVRRLWLERQAAAQSEQLVREVSAEVTPLLAARESRYSTGGGQQADYLAAKLKLDRLKDRELMFRERRLALTEALAGFLGEAAYRNSIPARLAAPRSRGELLDALETHPLLQAQDAQVAVRETGVELAQEKFSPRWALDVSYGDRRGVDALGVERPDFASAMISMSIPIFNRDQKRREVSAAESRKRAANWQRIDLQRRLQSQLTETLSSHSEVNRQLELQEEELLPIARQAVDSTSRAYANDLVPLDQLAETYLDLLALELRRLDLIKRRGVLQAELDYLGGSEK